MFEEAQEKIKEDWLKANVWIDREGPDCWKLWLSVSKTCHWFTIADFMYLYRDNHYRLSTRKKAFDVMSVKYMLKLAALMPEPVVKRSGLKYWRWLNDET